MSKIKIELKKRTKEEVKSYIEGYNKAIKDIKHFIRYYGYNIEEAILEAEIRSDFMNKSMEEEECSL